MENNTFFTWIRDTGLVRHDDRWFAGVASGIAHKAGVDPLLVRGIFIVLALLGGPGVVLYLVGWLLLPDSNGRIHIQSLLRGQTHPGVIVGLIALVVLVFSAGFSTLNIARWDVWNIIGVPSWVNITLTWVFWLVVCAGAAYLVHLIMIQHGRNTPSGSPADSSAGSPADDGQYGSGQPDVGEEAAGDAGVKTSRIPQQVQSVTQGYANWWENRPKASIGYVLITLALALIGGGIGALWAHTSGIATTANVPSPSMAVLVAGVLVATVVIACALLIAGLRGRSASGLSFFGTLGIVVLVTTAVLPWGTDYYAIGNPTITQPSSSIFVGVGNSTIYLDEFDPDDDPHEVEIHQLVGDLNLQLPTQRPTKLTLVVSAGSIESEQGTWPEQSGLLTKRVITVNEDSPGEPLEVVARVGAGNITVASGSNPF